MKHRLPVLLLLGLLLCLLLACAETYDSESTYFDGSVVVHYHQTTSVGENDYVSFTFNRTGKYEVDFKYTSGQGQSSLPASFTINVTQAPLSKEVSQRVLPNFLTVSIRHNGVTESHDFS